MNKNELIEYIASSLSIAKADAARMVDAYEKAVVSELKQGRKVSLTGFGTYRISERKARIGRNPKTKETIQIAASRVPVFKAGKEFKEAVN